MPPDEPRDDESDDEARAFILARRAKFVAAALASAGLASAACDGPGPLVCLTPPPGPSVTAPPPMVCLTPVAQPAPDSGNAAASGGQAAVSAPSSSTSAPAPSVCLRVRPPNQKPTGTGPARPSGPPSPRVCLSEMHRPVDDSSPEDS
jgi:hypothetical protein